MKKIYLAVSDPDLYKAVKLALRQQGYEIKSASDSRVDLLSWNPDLVISDTEITTSPVLRKLLLSVRVLFLDVAYNSDSQMENQLGIKRDTLMMPFTLVDLLKEVKKLLG